MKRFSIINVRQAPAATVNRREFLKTASLAAGTLMAWDAVELKAALPVQTQETTVPDLPKGSAPRPVSFNHFPSRLHALIWRNWQLVPVERLARVIGAKRADLVRMGRAMGLSDPPRVTHDQQRRSYLTVIRRNWHLLPYEQLLELLGWTPEQMAFTLREDDFLYTKLGNLKPDCLPLKYQAAAADILEREREIANIIRRELPAGVGQVEDPLFGFVERLSAKPAAARRRSSRTAAAGDPLRYCYSYFALYGDPLLEGQADPYPDGYLNRLADSGVNGVWLQAVLYKLAPFPWDARPSHRHEERLRNLRALVTRARKHGMGVYLYQNEPRAMPRSFFEQRPQLKGVVEGDHAALCTSDPEVQRYMVESVAHICRAVPDLAGLFTITGSENLTNCWSHGAGAKCPRCGKREPAEVIAELNGLFREGIRKAESKARLLVWDWGWADGWVEGIVNRLPTDAALISVSEWNVPIERGGVKTTIGEYSISAVGPGPRARRHWDLARKRGLKTIAKIQAGNTWELSAVPYIPAVANVARHAANLRAAGVDGLMLGWTLGGYPSPNLEVVAEIGRSDEITPEAAMETVARQRFGAALAPAVVQAWRAFSVAFSEFPFHGGVVYQAPMQFGPSNLLWAEPTGYRATMIGFPYDDLDGWRAVYPPEVFAAQFEKIADGFERAITALKAAIPSGSERVQPFERRALDDELNVATAAAIHFRSTANQARFVLARRALAAAKTAAEARPQLSVLETVLGDEIALARRLYEIQIADSRIGFEASNQYYYVPVDLGEKILNCHDLLQRWLPAQRARFGLPAILK